MNKIEVEVKIVGMFGADFLAVAEKVSLSEGARPADALAALHKSGAISKQVYKQVKSFRPPFYLVLNDEKQDGKPKSIRLQDGDRLSVLQLATGG